MVLAISSVLIARSALPVLDWMRDLQNREISTIRIRIRKYIPLFATVSLIPKICGFGIFLTPRVPLVTLCQFISIILTISPNPRVMIER